MTTTTITNNPDRSRYEMLDAGVVIGQAAYFDDVAGDQVAGQRIFYHTAIDDGYGGRGLAGKLAAQALDETVAAGLRIVPVCPFIKKYLGKHPGYAPNVAAPTPAHLEFLRASLSQRAQRVTR
ncbi:GNAT family N-acetyltransferase [Arthrobacter sp. NPDC058192]|uniref:GNAT family N-acetyltransferase n=1 Tax=Arthrobacter sp. NPDC058192 TaxID=3346372 RepID=UPI0036DFB626